LPLRVKPAAPATVVINNRMAEKNNFKFFIDIVFEIVCDICFFLLC